MASSAPPPGTSTQGSAASVPLTVVADFHFARSDRDRLSSALTPGELILASDHEALLAAIKSAPHAQILCSFRPPRELRRLLPAIHWVQLPSAGADGAVSAGLLAGANEPVVTTASGIHAIPIAEYTLSSMLMYVRHWPQMIDLQRTSTWPERPRRDELGGRELYGHTVGIVGLGNIGRQIAVLARAFGMRTFGLRRSPSATQSDQLVDQLYMAAALHEMLAASDFVVIAVPRTPATHHLIDEQALRHMRSHAYLVNIARGDVVDETALIRALRESWIGGAGLDVFEHEPLATDSPLWSLPNVILSPHVSGSSEQYSARFTDLFLDNLRRFREGKPLRNVVDPARGY